LWTVKPDGSGLRQLHVGGFYACWSPDGQWLYFSPPRDRPWRIVKARVDGTEVVDVRADNALAPAVAQDGTLYFACTDVRGAFGDFEICAARVEQGTAEVLARVSGTRVPLSSVLIHMFLSPDGAALAMPLSDGLATDLWVLPARGGALKSITAFAGRAIMISRRVSWAPDSQSIFAAVEESDADVISFAGLL
jgi:Tol biopolymer transport system component